jgi:caspase domain-containing protein/Sel1 repeat-containing protein
MRSWIGVLGLAAVIVALMSIGDAGGKSKPAKEPDPAKVRDPKELQIVDCLLPGQIRKLGAQQTFMSRRRPMRTTALDCEIRGGEYVAYDRANYQTALHVWLETAEAGDAQAQDYVGEIYEKGLGVPPDYAQAAAWYRKAADQGLAQAQINLGFLCEKGLGVPQDAKQALEWYRKATGVSGVIMLDSEVEAVRQELTEANKKIEAARSDVEALERELQATRRDLESARASGKKSATETAALETRVAALESKLGTDQKQIATLRESTKRYDIAGPTIEIVDSSAVRSASAPQSGATGDVVGRVEAPAGLAELTADGEKQTVQEGGFFRFHPRARRVTLVAVDLQGKRGQLVHDLDAMAAAPEAKPRSAAKFGTYRALVIGNANYLTLPHLATAANDATVLKDVLERRYGFKVTLLQDARYLDILSAFSVLQKELRESDNLIIYFAGHGELDSASGLGYWLPVDASKESKTNWISSREVSMQLQLLPARHVLVIADSCYSGALTRSALARGDTSSESGKSGWMAEVAAKRSRTALTSGGLDPVLDAGGGGHSIFARSLLDALARPAEPLETYRLWSSVKARVMYETRSLREQQVPEYAPIQHAGHEGGEFFFVPVKG